MVCVHFMSYVSTKCFYEKIFFYMAYVKMIKFGAKISLFITCFLCVLSQPTKISVFFSQNCA
jgi:hypothetical protein